MIMHFINKIYFFPNAIFDDQVSLIGPKISKKWELKKQKLNHLGHRTLYKMVDASQSADQFALKYRGCGILGLLACLYIMGEFSHKKIFKSYRSPTFIALGTGVPPSLVGGFIGLIILFILKELIGFNFLVDNCKDQLHEMVHKLIYI